MAISIAEQLTEEGRRMWDNIELYEAITNGQDILPKKKALKIKLNYFELEVVHIRTELRRMIKNSQKVVQDCEAILAAIKDKEEYLKSEAKTAKLIHSNLIIRLQRVLDLQNAFDHPIWVDDEPARPYKR